MITKQGQATMATRVRTAEASELAERGGAAVLRRKRERERREEPRGEWRRCRGVGELGLQAKIGGEFIARGKMLLIRPIPQVATWSSR
jgi:hypothetical protein